MNDREIIDYLAGLDEAERKAAFNRINAGVKLKAPADEVDPLKSMFIRLDDYLDQELETPPFLVSSGQVVKGEITALIARAGKGKTTLVRNRMIRWAAGLPLFHDLKDSQVPTKPLKILLLENEGVAWDMQRKLGRLLEEADLDMEDRERVRENLYLWGDGGYSGLKVDDDEDYKLIDHNLGILQPDVFIMEPFRGLWRGEENDATQMEATLDRIVQLATNHQCAIMLSHHERKSGAGEDGEWMSASRGSGVLEGKVAVMENFRSIKEGQFRELAWSKSRYFPTQGAVRMKYIEESHRYEMVPENELAQQISALLTQEEDWFTVVDLEEHFEESGSKIYRALKQLLDNGTIIEKSRKTEKGARAKHYRVPAPGDDNSEERLGMT